jgi:LysM repeat protein
MSFATPGSTHRSHLRVPLGVLATVPIVLAGTIAVSCNFASPALAAQPTKRPEKAPSGATGVALEASTSTARSASGQLGLAAIAPQRYTVVTGDTISSIASRFGLSTATVLALNGLSWKSLIFPGQSLALIAPTPAAATPAAPAAPAVAKYVVASGDTISGIARAHGLSTQAVLSANGLASSSLIFPGQSITLPAAAVTTSAAPTPAPAPAPAPTPVPAPAPAPVITPMTDEMRQNAEVIVAVGRRDGVSDYGLIIALAAAMQESGLRNVDGGDQDSLGLFQQRPSAGWGPPAQIMNPTESSLAFFGGPNNPNAGRTKGLLDIPGWQAMTVTEAAQAVQISAYPTAYAKWETSARVWLTQLG